MEVKQTTQQQKTKKQKTKNESELQKQKIGSQLPQMQDKGIVDSSFQVIWGSSILKKLCGLEEFAIGIQIEST